MSQDPIGYGDGLNMYAYVKNDPVNYRDPMGLDGDDAPTEEITVTEERRSKPALSTKELSDLFGAGASDIYNGHESASQRRKRLEDEEGACGRLEFSVAIGIDLELIGQFDATGNNLFAHSGGIVLGFDTQTFLGALKSNLAGPASISSALAISFREIAGFHTEKEEAFGVDGSVGLLLSINPSGPVSDFAGKSLVFEGGSALSGGFETFLSPNTESFGAINLELSAGTLVGGSASIENTNLSPSLRTDSCKR